MRITADTAALTIQIECSSYEELRARFAALLAPANAETNAQRQADAPRQQATIRKRRPWRRPAKVEIVRQFLAALVHAPRDGISSTDLAHALGLETAVGLGPKARAMAAGLLAKGLAVDDVRILKRSHDGMLWQKGPRFQEACQMFGVSTPDVSNHHDGQGTNGALPSSHLPMVVEGGR